MTVLKLIKGLKMPDTNVFVLPRDFVNKSLELFYILKIKIYN